MKQKLGLRNQSHDQPKANRQSREIFNNPVVELGIVSRLVPSQHGSFKYKNVTIHVKCRLGIQQRKVKSEKSVKTVTKGFRLNQINEFEHEN